MRLKLFAAISSILIGVLVGAGAKEVLESISSRYHNSSAFVTVGVGAFVLTALVWTAYFEEHRATEGKDKKE